MTQLAVRDILHSDDAALDALFADTGEDPFAHLKPREQAETTHSQDGLVGRFRQWLASQNTGSNPYPDDEYFHH